MLIVHDPAKISPQECCIPPLPKRSRGSEASTPSVEISSSFPLRGTRIPSGKTQEAGKFPSSHGQMDDPCGTDHTHRTGAGEAWRFRCISSRGCGPCWGGRLALTRTFKQDRSVILETCGHRLARTLAKGPICHRVEVSLLCLVMWAALPRQCSVLPRRVSRHARKWGPTTYEDAIPSPKKISSCKILMGLHPQKNAIWICLVGPMVSGHIGCRYGFV